MLSIHNVMKWMTCSWCICITSVSWGVNLCVGSCYSFSNFI